MRHIPSHFTPLAIQIHFFLFLSSTSHLIFSFTDSWFLLPSVAVRMRSCTIVWIGSSVPQGSDLSSLLSMRLSAKSVGGVQHLHLVSSILEIVHFSYPHTIIIAHHEIITLPCAHIFFLFHSSLYHLNNYILHIWPSFHISRPNSSTKYHFAPDSKFLIHRSIITDIF